MRRTVPIILVLLVLVGCMERADLSDAAMRPFADMYAVDRTALGLTPVPRTGAVSIERPSAQRAAEEGYDAMLHLSAPTQRTIAFERVGGEYRWLGEEELTFGPREYETADGRQREFVAITYYRHALFGQPAGLRVDYWGPDTRLAHRPGLTLADVQPLLDTWRRRR